MKTNHFIKMSLLVVAIVGLTFSPVILHAQALFSVKQNGFSQEKVAQLTAQVEKSDVSTLSLTKNNESKDVYLMTLSSVENSEIIILNEQTGANVVLTPVNQSIIEFQLTPFFIEEMKQSVLGDAENYLVMETTSDYSVKSTVSVSASNGEVMIPRYFYGAKENVKEALPKERQIIGVFKAKPQLISAFPDDPEVQRHIAQLEEAMSYYVYMFRLPDGTLCTYDEHFNSENGQYQNSMEDGPLQFALTGQMTSAERNAIEYALGLWSKKLSGKVPIDIRVDWVNMGDPMILGASYVMQDFLNTQTNTWYPSALWNQLVGYDATTNNDIRIKINSTFSWYLGTDGDPSYNQVDCVTVMLHEVNHGLGFADNVFMFPGYEQYHGFFFFSYGDGSVGLHSGGGNPNAFSRQLFQDTSGSCISELTVAQRIEAVTSNNLYAGRPDGKLLEANGGNRVKMYAPNPYQEGSSVSHWDNSVSFTTFMKYGIGFGKAIHTINKWELGMLWDIGWTANDSDDDCVGVTNLKVDFNLNCDAQITWNAPTDEQGSGDNYKYNVYRDGAKIASNIPTTSYTDTELDHSQIYTWNVKVVCDDGDESADVSVIEGCPTAIAENETSTFSVYPNPTTGQLTITNYELEITTVNYTVYNVMGQMVMQGKLSDETTTIDVESLPAGMYFLRIGEKTTKFVKH